MSYLLLHSEKEIRKRIIKLSIAALVSTIFMLLLIMYLPKLIIIFYKFWEELTPLEQLGFSLVFIIITSATLAGFFFRVLERYRFRKAVSNGVKTLISINVGTPGSNWMLKRYSNVPLPLRDLRAKRELAITYVPEDREDIASVIPSKKVKKRSFIERVIDGVPTLIMAVAPSHQDVENAHLQREIELPSVRSLIEKVKEFLKGKTPAVVITRMGYGGTGLTAWEEFPRPEGFAEVVMFVATPERSPSNNEKIITQEVDSHE